MSPDSVGRMVRAKENARLVYFDISEDGRHRMNWTLAGRNHATMFPPLPYDESEANEGWYRTVDDRPDTVYYAEVGLLEDRPQVLALRSRMDGLLCDLTESARSEVLLFDTAAGVYWGDGGKVV